MHEYLHDFDRTIAKWVQLLPSWLHPLMTAATFVGEPAVVLTIAGAVAIGTYVNNARRIALAEVLGMVGFGLNTVIKYSVHRTRPDTLYAEGMRIKSYSFPSGHAYGAMFFYGLLAYLAFTRLAHPWNWLVAAALLLLIFLVGLSRVYLGAHFPSDVTVGWLFGLFCLVLVIKILHI